MQLHTAMLNITRLLTIFLTLLLAATPISSGGRVLERGAGAVKFEVMIIMDFGEEGAGGQFIVEKNKPAPAQRPRKHPPPPPQMDPPPSQLTMVDKKKPPHPAVSPPKMAPTSHLIMVDQNKTPLPALSPPRMAPPSHLIMVDQNKPPLPAVSPPKMDTPPSELFMVDQKKEPYPQTPQKNPPADAAGRQQKRDMTIIIQQALRRLRGGGNDPHRSS